jgi:hypothetical protein
VKTRRKSHWRWLLRQAKQLGIWTTSVLGCWDLVQSALGEAARAAFEALMANGTYEYQSAFARKYVAQGRAEGEARGKAEDVLMVLEMRHHVVTEEQKQRILLCTDLAVLSQWLRKAVVLSRVEELFE